MCRWIAYRGLEIPLEHYVTEPQHSLISQSLNALEATASINGDGFGLGWYGDYKEPGLYHEVRPAWSDQNLRHLCRHIRSHLFFAHARAATATPVSHLNCHPFTYDGWMFMHNGFIGNWGRLRRAVEDLISDDLYPARVGIDGLSRGPLHHLSDPICMDRRCVAREKPRNGGVGSCTNVSGLSVERFSSSWPPWISARIRSN